MIVEETCERVITIGVRDRHAEAPGAKLLRELKELRDERFEIDLYLRGSWRRRWGRRQVTVFVETLLPFWRVQGGDVVSSVVLPSGTWKPAIGKTPPPEIVLRGVRKREV